MSTPTSGSASRVDREESVDGEFMDPFDRDRLKRHAPNPSLAAHFTRLSAENRERRTLGPYAGMHNLPHFRMMQHVTRGAWEQLRATPPGNRTAVVFGAKECADVPLKALATEGRVYLVDVDVESLHVARGSLEDSALRERAFVVCMDASLFETALLERAQALLSEFRYDIDRAFQAIVAMHAEASEREGGLFTGNQLPIKKGSVDLAISSMTLSQFMIGYLQTLVKLFLDVVGKEQAQPYFLSMGGASEKGLQREDRTVKLQRSTSSLARKAAEAHIRELCRIVKKGGVVLLSDHTLHGRCTFCTNDEVEVDIGSLRPYSKNPEEEKVLRYREDPGRRLPGSLRVNTTLPDRTVTIEGTDALKTLVTRDDRVRILNEQGWWWVTERAKDFDEASPAWHVSYVEAFTFNTKESV
jgi:hypothetical protein